MTAFTSGTASNAIIYPTHPQWAADGQHIIFRSNRAGGVWQAFAVHETTGEIVQLTDGPGTGGSLNVARLSNRLYFLRRVANESRLIELNLDPLLADSAAGTPQGAASYERQIAVLPANLAESGGFALDADETTAYIGVTRLDESPTPSPEDRAAYRAAHPESPIAPRPGGIRSIDLHSGELKTVVDVPFTMGHVQTNPWVPGEIIYCDETGGYAEQRIWSVGADGNGNRPIYPQAGGEWVTHEVCADADHLLFLIMAHLPRLRRRPTGIALLNLRTEEMRILSQLAGKGFWHCNASRDGKWVVADDFDGNVHLIDRHSGEMTLLSTGHKMRPDHAHPTFSPDSKRILIQSGLFTDGASLDVMVISLPFALLQRR